jgi:hypothetical protein
MAMIGGTPKFPDSVLSSPPRIKPAPLATRDAPDILDQQEEVEGVGGLTIRGFSDVDAVILVERRG